MPSPGTLLTIEEVAEMLRKPVSTMRYWRQSGGGPPSFKLGCRVVYRREAVERWLAEVEAADPRTPAA